MEDTTPQVPGQEQQATPADTPQQPAEQPAVPNRYEAMYQAPQVPTIDPATFKNEILAGVKDAIAAAQPKPAEAEPADWLKLLSEGKKEEGVRALARELRGHLDIDALQRDAVSQALSMSAAERQVESYIMSIRQDPANSEVLRLEPYITRAANDRVQAAHATGKIKSPADYVQVTRQAIDEELQAARQLTLAIRGESRNEVQLRTQQVLATPNLTPNTVNPERGAAKPPAEQIESANDYITRRQQLDAKRRGMAVN